MAFVDRAPLNSRIAHPIFSPARRGHLILFVAAAASCGKVAGVGGVAGLAGEHRAEVDAFSAKLLAVDSKIANAPADASGFKLAAGESLRVRGTDKDNTLVIEKSVFQDVVANHANRDNFWRDRVEPETDSDLYFLFKATYTPRDDYAGDATNTLNAYKRVLAWYPNIRYVAVLLASEKQDYSVDNTTLAARWRGRVPVFDLSGGTWVGAVSVALEGKPAEIFEYVTVNRGTHQRVSGPFKLVDQDISDARSKFITLLDKAVKQALESGSSVTSVSQLTEDR
jgi:hypothetical protein